MKLLDTTKQITRIEVLKLKVEIYKIFATYNVNGLRMPEVTLKDLDLMLKEVEEFLK